MARDPAALFADLHEALRRGRLMYTTAGNDHLKLPPELAHITAVRPVYDCPPVLEQWLDAGRAGDHDTFATMMNRGVDLADEMLLVAERCAQMWSYYSDGEGLTTDLHRHELTWIAVDTGPSNGFFAVPDARSIW